MDVINGETATPADELDAVTDPVGVKSFEMVW